MAPLLASGTPKSRAIAGSPMFTIEASSDIKNAEVAASTRTSHLLALSGRSPVASGLDVAAI